MTSLNQLQFNLTSSIFGRTAGGALLLQHHVRVCVTYSNPVASVSVYRDVRSYYCEYL